MKTFPVNSPNVLVTLMIQVIVSPKSNLPADGVGTARSYTPSATPRFAEPSGPRRGDDWPWPTNGQDAEW
jgi:hypothetical protein